ncbi:hypothetical protein RND71_007754 [Anisodus tanguticus]|uniref:Uncharacterized protein n=1 Tax=Anisodus tanguticus TaxID=243964 RepID=A0AAE1VTS5_9SOLA|nr:hypothetical protein RND71_007754 [Anisodus tanguticus]
MPKNMDYMLTYSVPQQGHLILLSYDTLANANYNIIMGLTQHVPRKTSPSNSLENSLYKEILNFVTQYAHINEEKIKKNAKKEKRIIVSLGHREEFVCIKYGKPNLEYLKYRWLPKGCVLPRFDGKKFLEKIQRKEDNDYGVEVIRFHSDYMVDIEVVPNVGRVLKLNSMKNGRIWKEADVLIFHTWLWYPRSDSKQPKQFLIKSILSSLRI